MKPDHSINCSFSIAARLGLMLTLLSLLFFLEARRSAPTQSAAPPASAAETLRSPNAKPDTDNLSFPTQPDAKVQARLQTTAIYTTPSQAGL